MFLKKSAAKLPKYLRINEHIIKLKTSKQLLYMLIYSFNSVKLEIFKAYIKTNLANGFI